MTGARHYQLVEITDKNGAVVGATSMSEAFEKELIRHTVYVMIIDAEGKYLLQKRSSKVPNYRYFWEASAGGHIDEGESPDSAAYRELKEELGLTGVALRYIESFYFESEGDGRTYKYYAHAYTGRLPVGVQLQYDEDEVGAVWFCAASEIDKLDKVTPITRHIITLL